MPDSFGAGLPVTKHRGGNGADIPPRAFRPVPLAFGRHHASSHVEAMRVTSARNAPWIPCGDGATQV